MFALLVPSCCDKSGTSCYHLVTRLMTVTDLLQVVPTRLIQAVRNKLLRACCHQLVNNLLRADDIRFVGTTCCESVGLIHWSKDSQHNCKRDKLSIVKVGRTCLDYKVRFNSHITLFFLTGNKISFRSW